MYARLDRLSTILNTKVSFFSPLTFLNLGPTIGGMPRPKRVPSISDRLRLARSDAGLTLQQVADAVGTSRGGVYNWEHGKDFGASRAAALADALGVTLDWLLRGRVSP